MNSHLKSSNRLGNLENGDVSLEDSFKLYNEGMKLIQNCNQQLDKVEKKIVVLNQKEGDEDEF